MCGTEPIRYVTLHFRRGAAKLRSVVKIAPKSLFLRVNTEALSGRVFVPAQSYPVGGEHSLSQFQALLFPTPNPVAANKDTTKAMAVKTSLDKMTSRCLKLPRDYPTLVHSAE